MSQYDCDRIFRGPSKSGAAFGELQGSVIFASAPVEHAERSQQPYLLECVTTILGDRESSHQGLARRLACTAREDQRDAQRFLKDHLLPGAMVGGVQAGKRPFTPP